MGNRAQILALGGRMYFKKLSSFGFGVLASISRVAPPVATRGQQRREQKCAGASAETWVADGGAPVPPVPPPPKRNGSANPQLTLLADGGAPVPPVPTKPPASYTIADGGAPVPPVPPPPRLSSTLTPQANLTADGGAPVPPVPPKQPQPSIPDGGAPVRP